MTREPGQSQASVDALAAYLRTVDATSVARVEARRLRRELRLAVQAQREAEAAEAEAERAYFATPYAEGA